MPHRLLSRVPRAVLLLLAGLLTLPVAGCDPKKDDLVVITYRPVASFRSYEHVNADDPTDVKKSSVDNQSHIMTVYRIVSVVNNGQVAGNFVFDVGRIRAGAPEANFGNVTLASSESSLGLSNFLVPLGFKDNVVPGTKEYDLLNRVRLLIQTSTTIGEEQVAAKLTYTDPNGRKVLMVMDPSGPPQTLLNPGTPATLAALGDV